MVRDRASRLYLGHRFRVGYLPALQYDAAVVLVTQTVGEPVLGVLGSTPMNLRAMVSSCT
jgi:hypothetical protein